MTNSQCIVVVVFNIVNNMADYTDFAIDKSAKNVTSVSTNNSFFQSLLTSTDSVTPTKPTVCKVSYVTFEEDFQTPKSSKGGGLSCCVPLCYNNSKTNPDLSFYVISKDEKLRKIRLSSESVLLFIIKHPSTNYFKGRNFRGKKLSPFKKTAKYLHFAGINFRE